MSWRWKELRVIPLFGALLFACHYGWLKLQFNPAIRPQGEGREIMGYNYDHLAGKYGLGKGEKSEDSSTDKAE